MPATLEPAPSAPARDESDALFEEARRRQRRRWRGIAVALLAAALATALLLEAGGSGPKRPRSAAQPGHPGRRPAPGASRALAVLPGADTGLLIWPAAVKPITILRSAHAERLFYERHPATPNPARVVNLDTGRSVVRPIPGLLRVGSTLLAVGDWLVYNSTKGLAVIKSDLLGTPRIIGHASSRRARSHYFVPGVNDRIWLEDRTLYPEGLTGPSSVATSVQSVSVPNGTRGPQARATEGHIRSRRGHRPWAAALRRHATDLPP